MQPAHGLRVRGQGHRIQPQGKQLAACIKPLSVPSVGTDAQLGCTQGVAHIVKERIAKAAAGQSSGQRPMLLFPEVWLAD